MLAMAPEYEISDGGDFHIAHHRADPKKDARIDREWTEEKDDEIYAPWEELVAAILNDDITKHVDISSQSQMGSVGSDKATQNLVSEIDDIESKEHAKALLEALQQEQVVEWNNDEVVLFDNISGDPENPNFLYNWAAAMQLARAKIEDQIERARELDEQLQKDLEEIHVIGKDFVEEDPDEQLQRLDQKFEALGDGEGVPDPETLSQSERREYNQYQRTFQIARSRKRIQERYTVEGGEVAGTDDVMQGQIENFQHLHQAFSEYEKQLRTMIRTNKWRNQNVDTMLDGLIDMISGIGMLDQSMEDMSHEDIENTLDELTDSRDQAYEAGKDITDGVKDEKVEEELEGQTQGEFADNFEQ